MTKKLEGPPQALKASLVMDQAVSLDRIFEAIQTSLKILVSSSSTLRHLEGMIEENEGK